VARPSGKGRAVAGVIGVCAMIIVALLGLGAPSSASAGPAAGSDATASAGPAAGSDAATATGQAMKGTVTSPDPPPGVFGAKCTFPFCGRINNDTSVWFELSQNFTDAAGCEGPYDSLAPWQNSYQNPYKDTDCIGTFDCSFTVDDAGPFPSGYWVRIHNLPWAQTVKCV
jgi:hypothetical protein